MASEAGEGSRFSFSLRFTRGPSPAAEAPPAGLDGLRVLVVDDNDAAREALTDVLGQWKVVAGTAPSAQAAMASLEAAAADGTPWTVALIDAEMPDVDGFALARQMLHDDRVVPTKVVMMLSAGVRVRPERRRADRAIAARLSKPVKQSDLREALVALGRPPARRQTRAGTAARVAAPPRPLDVLVVEDNATNQRVVTHVLKKRGHRVTAVATGQAALETVGVRTFDVILMDVQMPGMDGFETTAAIRAQEQTTGTFTPIVAVTAHAMADDRDRCLAAGMNAFVAKPLRPASLLATIERLAAPQAPGAAGREAPAPPARRRGKRLLDLAPLLEAFGGDRAVLDETIAVFLADLPAQRTALATAVAARRTSEVQQAAHAIKGAVGLFSTGAPYEAARRLEATARAGTLAQADRQGAALDRALSQLTTALSALRQELAVAREAVSPTPVPSAPRRDATPRKPAS